MGRSYEEQVSEFHTPIANALAAWSGVEEAILLLSKEISGITDNAKARLVFTTIISFETRLDICNSLMRLSGESEENLAVWSKLYNKLRKSYKKRH